MSALTDDRLDFRPVEEWRLPTDVKEFLAVLAKTPTLGKTNKERIERFLSFPQAANMPRSLRRELDGMIR